MDAIEEGIARFPRWHYQFELDGHRTPIFDPNHVQRHEERRRYFFEPLVRHYGGSLEGKRVLDLGCNAGFWALQAINAGCEYVLGIDGRQMHIDQANFVFDVSGIDRERYDFVAGNLFETDFESLGQFDIVLCLGLMYHVAKPVELVERIASVNTDTLVIDTAISTAPGSYLELRHEATLDEPRSAVDYQLVVFPTARAVFDIVEQFGYSALMAKPRFSDYVGSRDYQLGQRRAFICAKGPLPSRAFESEPVRNPRSRALQTATWLAWRGSKVGRERVRRIVRLRRRSP